MLELILRIDLLTSTNVMSISLNRVDVFYCNSSKIFTDVLRRDILEFISEILLFYLFNWQFISSIDESISIMKLSVSRT